jgi:hypothetical protein
MQVHGGGEALVYVLLEHQSTFDPRMPLRLLQYLVRVWEAWDLPPWAPSSRSFGSCSTILRPTRSRHSPRASCTR